MNLKKLGFSKVEFKGNNFSGSCDFREEYRAKVGGVV